MSVTRGDTGGIKYGQLKTVNITYPTPRESNISAITLPTTEPGSPQISYTVQSSDLAVFSRRPISVSNIPLVYIGGQIGAASTNVSYRLLVNGVSQATGSASSITANYYFNLEPFFYIPINVGDVVTVNLWSNQTDTIVNYQAFTTIPSRFKLTTEGIALSNVSYTVTTTFPTLTQAPTPINVSYTQVFYNYLSSNLNYSMQNSTYQFSALVQDATYGFGRISYGDNYSLLQSTSSATNKTNYHKNYMPSSISFREIL